MKWWIDMKVETFICLRTNENFMLWFFMWYWRTWTHTQNHLAFWGAEAEGTIRNMIGSRLPHDVWRFSQIYWSQYVYQFVLDEWALFTNYRK